MSQTAVIKGLLLTRSLAIKNGDASVARCCDVELAQHGYTDPELETTAASALPENTARPRARKKKSR